MFIFLILLSLAVLLKTVSVSAQTLFISAQDPRILVSGRTEINADGISRSFDWEGTVFYITVTGSGPVYLNVTSTAVNVQRVTTDVRAGGEWYTSSRVWVNQGPNLLQVAVAEANTDDNVIRCFFELEPAFTNTDANGYFTVYGFSLANGAAVGTPMTPLSRNIEIVGDSISAGYGSMGNGGGCPVASWTSSNYYAWDQYICRQFNANCTVVAWSGKGMYQNCCDNGETMPSYYLQTRGGNAYVSDWDFTRFIPDAMLINLGTNDFNHDSGQSWEHNFTNTYIQFVLNATARYNRPKLPVFLAQGNMNNGLPLQNALIAAASAINASGGVAFYLDMRAGPTDGCGGHPGIAGTAAMYKAAVPQIATAMSWTWDLTLGFIAEGNDVIPPIANLSLGLAQSKCLETPGCAAITFSDTSPNPKQISLTYFKNISGTTFESNWYTYINLAIPK